MTSRSRMRPLAPAPRSSHSHSLPLLEPRPSKPVPILAKPSSNVIHTNKSSTITTASSIKRAQSTSTSTSDPSSSSSTSTSPNDPVTPISADHNNPFNEKKKEDVTLVKPEKEWVLPQRAKPGRKPSQVEPPTKRKAQNRASQRAFRERKQDYLASLEQKVLAYESAEVAKTIELQKIARGVNEENEKLKEENHKLKRICQDLQSELNRWKEGSTGDRFSNQVGVNAKKRNFSGCKAPFHESRSSSISLNGEVERVSPPNHGYGNPNGGLSPDSSNSGESFPLDGMGSSTSKLRSLSLESNPNQQQQQQQQTITSSSTSSPHYLISPTRAISGSNSKERMVRNKSSNGSSGGGLKPCTDTDRDCGFCTESSPCVCAGEADLDLNEGENESITASNNQPTMSVGSLLGPTSSSPGYPSSKLRVNYRQGNGSGSVDQSSRRLGGATKAKPKLWEIHSTSSSTSTKSKLWPTVPAQFSSIQTDPSLSNISSTSNNPISISLPCSGDPSTCSACSTDPGLAAFCEAINRNLDGTLSSPAILDVGNSVRIRSRSESQGQSSFKINPFDRKGNDDRERNSIIDSSHSQNQNRNGTKLWPSFPSSSTSNHLQRPSLPLPLPSTSSLTSFPNPINSSRPLPPPLPNRKETIPEAWAQIRSHPRFNQWGGGLSLLADVVSGRTSSTNQSGSSLERRRRAPSVEINHHDETFNSTTSNTRPILQRKLSVTRGTGNISERNNGDSRLKLVPLSSLEGISDREVRSGNEKGGNNSSGGDSEMKDLTQQQQQQEISSSSSSSLRDESEEGGGERGSKRRRLYVETDAVRDALALLDRGLPPREEDENGGRGFNEGRRPSLPCPCPWKPSA